MTKSNLWLFSLSWLTHESAHGTTSNFVGKLKNILWDGRANQKLSNLITEIVAIMSQQAVSLSCITRADFSQISFKHIFWDMRNAQINDMDWCSKRCISRKTVIDSTTIIVFIVIHYNPSVPEMHWRTKNSQSQYMLW